MPSSCSFQMKSLHRIMRLGRQVVGGGGGKGLLRKKRFSVRAQRPGYHEMQKYMEMGCLAVRRAARLCREVQLGLTASEEIGKADDSPVTVADFGAQAIVAYTLHTADVGSSVISLVAEETAEAISGSEHRDMRRRIVELVNRFIPDDAPVLSETDVLDLINLGLSEGGGSGIHWVLDPIDGTRGFVSARQYAICLGLLAEGEAVMGLLGCPNMPRRKIECSDGQPPESLEVQLYQNKVGCLFTGTKSGKAHVGSLWSEEAPWTTISVDKNSPMADIRFMESFESRHSNHDITQMLAKHLGIQQTPLRLDSQAKYGALSRGDAGLYMRFPPTQYREKIWDHCAGAVIVEAAGGKITDATGAPLDFSQGRFLDIKSGIVAAAPNVHAECVSLFNNIPQS